MFADHEVREAAKREQEEQESITEMMKRPSKVILLKVRTSLTAQVFFEFTLPSSVLTDTNRIDYRVIGYF